MRIIRRSSVSCFKMTFPYILEECQELIDEIKARNVKKAWTELMDVYTCTLCWVSDKLSIDLPIIENKSTRTWSKRWLWWEKMLKSNGLHFSTWMMKYGSNHERKYKVKLILWMSRVEKQLT